MLSVVEVIAVTVVSAAIVAGAQYLFKKGVPKFSASIAGILSLAHNRMVIAGIVVYVAGLLVYLVALGSEQLSFVYPAFSSTFIFVILISHFKLNERITTARLAGVALIIVGILLVSLNL
jgi:uncharacterized membrane protein